jgi:hypothetical protein
MLTALALVLSQISPQLQRYVYPLAPQKPCPPVVVDATDLPAQQFWGDSAKAVVEQWYPRLTSLLSTQSYKGPKTIHLVIKKTLEVPAYASNDTITINGDWITKHPDDLGMIVHELTHIVQSYPNSRTTPGWLVEGIADYTRWWRYEPEAPRRKIDFAKANYTDAYTTTAAWLAWASDKYNRSLVPTLDLALRERRDPMPEFKKLTGKSAEELWQEFKAAKF